MSYRWNAAMEKNHIATMLLILSALLSFTACSKPEDSTPAKDVYYMWNDSRDYSMLTLRDIHRTMREGECTFNYDGETLELANYTLDVTQEGDDILVTKVSNNSFPHILINTDLFISELRAMKWKCGER